MDVQATKPVFGVAASRAAREQAPAAVAPALRVPAPPEPKPVPVRDLQHTLRVVAEHLREYMRSADRDLQFSVDGDAGTTVITVRDASGEVIRQIPNEEALRMMRRLNAESGTLVDLTA